jgi:hypothetical protein
LKYYIKYFSFNKQGIPILEHQIDNIEFDNDDKAKTFATRQINRELLSDSIKIHLITLINDQYDNEYLSARVIHVNDYTPNNFYSWAMYNTN